MEHQRLCSICLDAIELPIDTCVLDCHHVFHITCIRHWFHTQLQQSQPLSCPLCRQHHTILSQRQIRHLISTGILSIPTATRFLFGDQYGATLEIVLTQSSDQITRFQNDATYTLRDLMLEIGVRLLYHALQNTNIARNVQR